MEVAELRTLIAVRDSKDPDGPKLLFPVAEWRSFTDAVQVGRFELGLGGGQLKRQSSMIRASTAPSRSSGLPYRTVWPSSVPTVNSAR